MIRIYDIDDNIDVNEELQAILPQIPKWCLDKVLSYRFNIDRYLCAKSFIMLEEMLRENFGLNFCPEFSYCSNGKPYLREHPYIYFNISHCHKGIACAVMDEPVGIDIEEIQFDVELAGVILNRDELEAVRSSDDPAVKFTEFWTRKESFLKLTGDGLRDNMKDVLAGAHEVSFTTAINQSAAYVCSTAIWKKKDPALLCHSSTNL